jgi:sulfate permease, SulP family
LGYVSTFEEKFDVHNDPVEVIIEYAESRVVNMSAVEALNKITDQYH